ncbi:hypothetical protein ACFY4C_22650 [Actinomadura viridis]|uniref:hypothetical protein n=1 Tax=Actinomadura viridis TaxID=58110 RepID=UPI0036BE1C55
MWKFHPRSWRRPPPKKPKADAFSDLWLCSDNTVEELHGREFMDDPDPLVIREVNLRAGRPAAETETNPGGRAPT